MGRIKGTHIKAVTDFMIEQNPAAMSSDFGENKKILATMGMRSNGKKERNKLAGQITRKTAKLDRIAKQQEREERATTQGQNPAQSA